MHARGADGHQHAGRNGYAVSYANRNRPANCNVRPALGASGYKYPGGNQHADRDSYTVSFAYGNNYTALGAHRHEHPGGNCNRLPYANWDCLTHSNGCLVLSPGLHQRPLAGAARPTVGFHN